MKRLGAAAKADLCRRADSMREHADDGVRRGTRRRAGVLATFAMGALAGMFAMVSNNVLAVNFQSASNFHNIYTDRIVGTDAGGYLKAQDKYDADIAVAQVGFNEAKLVGLCLVNHQQILGVDMSLLVIAGEKVDGTAVAEPSITANQLFIASNRLAGQGDQIQSMTLGQSADTVTMGTYGPFAGGTAGAFGLQAKTMRISNLDADSYGIDLQGAINLPDLKIKIVQGKATKSTCATAY